MDKSENFDNEDNEFGVILDPREQRRRLSLAIKKVIYRDLPEEYQNSDFRRHSIHCSAFEFNPSPSFEIGNPICLSSQPSESSKVTQINPNPTKKFIKRKNSKKLSLKMSLSTDSQSSSASDDSNSA